jgi:hypothetical protein
MRLFIPIDQRASIAAGLEAPHSTRIVDVPVERIPAPIRSYIAQTYDLPSGELAPRTVPYGIEVETPRMPMPLTIDNALEWLQKYYMAHQAAIAARSAGEKRASPRYVDPRGRK